MPLHSTVRARHLSAAKSPESVRSSPGVGRSSVSTEQIEDHLRQVQRLVMQGELAATAVHEISNLLNIVLINARLLRDRHKGEPAEMKCIEPMLHAATVVATLCNQLRNLARPAATQARVIDLVETARVTFHVLEQVIARELVLVAPEDGSVPAYADPVHIDQMLINLVLNARDATDDEDGRISIRIGRGPGLGSFIKVEDNGSGMTTEVKRQLFTTFFTTKPPGQGTGLGLVTVQRLMLGMGGSLKLTSRPGRGTCLQLRFPPPVQSAGASVVIGETIPSGIPA